MAQITKVGWYRVTIAAIVAGWLLLLVVSWVVVPRIILDGYDSKSWGFINERIDSHRRRGEANGEDRSREWYANWGHSYARKGSILSTLLIAAALTFANSPRFRNRCRRFLFSPAAPLNLGVLRAVVFGMLLLLLGTEPIKDFANWQRHNFEWPSVGGPLLAMLPISGALVEVLLPVCIIATLMAMIGCFSRTSAFVSCLLAFYLLGIPQSSGKVNHTMHHVWLIAMLMACSRCGDAFSVDSLRLAIRRADSGVVRSIARSVRYGLPIRLSMLVLATCYFFPGFWKLASNGFVWVFSDNLYNQLLQKWFELETYEPPLPLYELPGFTILGACTAILFEIGFPLALLWRPSRIIWAGLGLLFHSMTRVLMNISFFTMQAMYVMFVDWQGLLAWVGRKVGGEPLVLLYDGECRLCRRTIAILLAFDWLQQLKVISALDRRRLERLEFDHLGAQELLVDMHVAWRLPQGGWESVNGYAAYQQIGWRVPLFWPLLPFLYLPPVATIGNVVYKWVASRRACKRASSSCRPGTVQKLRWSAIPLLFLAGGILFAQIVLGMGRLRTAWPVACYPLFDTLSTSTILWPEFEAIFEDGTVAILDDDALRDRYTESRYVPKLKTFVAVPPDHAEMRNMLREYVGVWRDSGELGTSPPAAIAVYTSTYHLTGPRRPVASARRELIARFAWDELITVE